MAEEKEKKITLDQFLINFQKSFSRISTETEKIDKEQACSLIYGDVSFSMELKVENEEDKLVLSREGDVKISLDGKVKVDIRYDIE